MSIASFFEYSDADFEPRAAKKQTPRSAYGLKALPILGL